VEQLSQVAADEALERLGRTYQQALRSFERQRDLASNTLERLSHAFDFVSTDVPVEHERVAHYLGQTGDRMRRVAAYVASASPGSLRDDISDLARTRTGTAVGGFFLAGLALGRFLNSSGKRDASGRFDERESAH